MRNRGRLRPTPGGWTSTRDARFCRFCSWIMDTWYSNNRLVAVGSCSVFDLSPIPRAASDPRPARAASRSVAYDDRVYTLLRTCRKRVSGDIRAAPARPTPRAPFVCRRRRAAWLPAGGPAFGSAGCEVAQSLFCAVTWLAWHWETVRTAAAWLPWLGVWPPRKPRGTLAAAGAGSSPARSPTPHGRQRLWRSLALGQWDLRLPYCSPNLA
eukprot:COSAG02_NODE_17_length_55377_cov_106.402258_8_plen_211_part_00